MLPTVITVSPRDWARLQRALRAKRRRPLRKLREAARAYKEAIESGRLVIR